MFGGGESELIEGGSLVVVWEVVLVVGWGFVVDSGGFR